MATKARIKPTLVLYHPNSEIQKIYRFKNNRGASVITRGGNYPSYGGAAGLWEIAAVIFTGSDTKSFKFDDKIRVGGFNHGIMGWASDEDLENALKKIRALKPTTYKGY